MKKYKKTIILLTSIFIISGCGKSTPTSTIADLLVHFIEAELSVEPQVLTPEEKTFLEELNKTVKETQIKLESVGIKSKDRKDRPSKKTIRLESISVTILRYANNVMAQEAYEKFMEEEEKEKRRAKEITIPYFKDTYFLNSLFILEISHWKARLKNGKLGGWPDTIEIDESSLVRIKEVFGRFLH